MGALPAGAVLDTVRLVTTCGEKVYGTDVDTVRPSPVRSRSRRAARTPAAVVTPVVVMCGMAYFPG